MKKTLAKPAKPSTPDRFVPTKIELARACGLSRQAVHRYTKMPGAPVFVQDKGWPVDAVQRWILSKARRGDVAGKLDREFEELREREVFERVRRLRMANDREAETLMSRAEHEQEIVAMVTTCQRVFYAMPQKLAPEVVGLTVPEAEIRLQHAATEMVAALKSEPQ